jgi:hypothetical protein
MSYAEVMAMEDDDGEDEKAFRRGFYYGVTEVLDGLGQGYNSRQISRWAEDVLFDWWLSQDQSNRLSTPKIEGKPWAILRKEILDRDHRVCHYCGMPAQSVDHVVAWIRGGSDHPSNLVACCRSCNSRKHSRDVDDFVYANGEQP